MSRDCFPIALSTQRRKNIVAAYGAGLYECPITVENEKDALAALEDVKKAMCNALAVFLGNFGPETPETLIAQRFDGPVMYVAAAEGDGDMINGRGDAYCGMLNCSYNLGTGLLSLKHYYAQPLRYDKPLLAFSRPMRSSPATAGRIVPPTTSLISAPWVHGITKQ